jgi:hypothetical protein
MAEDMFPKPAVARMMHYQEGGECVAAIITRVNENSVDVTLFPSGHEPIARTDVRIGQASGSVHWPERM